MKARFHPQIDNLKATLGLFCATLAACGRPFFKDYATRLSTSMYEVISKDPGVFVWATIEWLLVNYHRTKSMIPVDVDLKDFKHPGVTSNGAFLHLSLPVYHNGVHHLFLYGSKHEGQWMCGMGVGFYEEKHLAAFLTQDLFVKDAHNEDKIRNCNVYICHASTMNDIPRERAMTGLRLLKQLADDGKLPQVGAEGVDYKGRDDDRE